MSFKRNEPRATNGMDYRARFRARQHDAAHAEADEPPAGHDCAHVLVPQEDAQLVLDDLALEQLINELRQNGRFAYDSEFIGELTYHPTLCLIQVATHERIALIDPFSDINLKPFWELLADPSVEKTVHAGAQDLEPVVRHLNRAPANLLDTQIAAGFVAMAYPVALTKLVNEVLGVRLGKGLTFTDWSQRPLSRQQLRYAADDVRFLPAVREELGKRLAERGHLEHAREESEALCEPSQYRFDPESDYLRVRGANTLSGHELNILKALVIWRESQAQSQDVPARAFLRDEILIDLSRRPAKTIDKLDRVKGLPRPVEQQHGQTIVDLTLRALAEPRQSTNGRQIEPTPTERFRADALSASMQVICASQGIDPALVASRQDIAEFGRRIAAGEDVSDLRLMTGWRRTVCGEQLMAFVKGEHSVAVRWQDQGLVNG
jgi:ribonuclease D